ncbi:MAG: LAGLIDADG family homing endonuclease [Elusimicrobiota bacterium]
MIWMKRAKWSIKEIEYLVKNFDKRSYKEIANELDKTQPSIAHKVSRLGLTNSGDWIKREVTFVLDRYKKEKPIWNFDDFTKEISRNVDKSVDEIKDELSIFGILNPQKRIFDWEWIKEKSEQGWTAKKIAEKLSFNHSAFLRRVRHFNEKLPENKKIDFSNKPKIPEEEYPTLVRMYFQGMSCNEIAEEMERKLGMSIARKTVGRRLEEMDIKKRSAQNRANISKKYDYRRKKLDLTKNGDGWFLGLVITDGCISEKQNRIQITQNFKNERDKNSFVERLKYILNFDNINEMYEEAYTFTICSEELAKNIKDYIKYGYEKSNEKFDNIHLKEHTKNNASKDFLRGLLRGVYEGDGTISNPDKINPRFAIYTASKRFMKDIRWLLTTLGIDEDRIKKQIDDRKENVVFQLRISQKDSVSKIIQLMYEHAEAHRFYQPEKKRRCDKALEHLVKKYGPDILDQKKGR